MTREQKNKLLDQLKEFFKKNDETTVTRPQFEAVLETIDVSKDLYGYYRLHGYCYGNGKVIKCR